MKTSRIPEGWTIKKLGKVLLYEQPQRYLVVNENYDNRTGTPVLTAGKSFILGYTGETSGIYSNVPAIIFDDFTTDSKYVKFPFKLKSSAAKILRPKNCDINLFYIYSLMQVLNIKPGGEHKRFWISEYSQINIPVPVLPEQSKIAEILATCDEVLAKTEAKIEKLRKIKQGLMQDLFQYGIDERGQIRTEATHRFRDSALGRIPVEWKIYKITQSFTIRAGQVNPSKPPYIDWYLIAPDHIESRTGRLLKLETARAQRAISGKYIFRKNDVVYSKIRPYLRKAIIANFDGLCSADMYPLTATRNTDPKFLLYLILCERFSLFAESVSMRSGFPKINRDELSEFLFAFPDTQEQSRIAAVLVSADETIEKEETFKNKLLAIKAGLMEDLLSGTVRVNHLLKKTA